MLSSKSGYSTGFTWVFGLVSLFGLGLLFIVFDQVFVAHLVPTIKNQVNTSVTVGVSSIDNATVSLIYSRIDQYMSFWHVLPYILFFVVVLYMIIAAIRKEKESEYT